MDANMTSFFEKTVYNPLIDSLIKNVFPLIVDAANNAAEVNEPFTMEKLLESLDIKNKKVSIDRKTRSKVTVDMSKFNEDVPDTECKWILRSGANANTTCRKNTVLYGYCKGHISTKGALGEINQRRLESGEDALSQEELLDMVPASTGRTKVNAPHISKMNFPMKNIPMKTVRGTRIRRVEKLPTIDEVENESVGDSDLEEELNNDVW